MSKKYRDLDIPVKGQSRSLKVVPLAQKYLACKEKNGNTANTATEAVVKHQHETTDTGKITLTKSAGSVVLCGENADLQKQQYKSATCNSSVIVRYIMRLNGRNGILWPK